MMARLWILAALAIVTTGLWPAAAAARQAEVNVYAGGFWPTETLGGEDFKDEGLWGVRAGGYLTDYLLLDGNLGYANEFSYSGTDVGTSAWLWDANLTLQFLPWDIRLSPFLTAGAGGLTAGVDNGDVFFLFADDGGFLEVGDPEPGLQFIHLEDGDTFFGVNYGGGLKATRLWGPVGFRFDLRGRTLPNFFGNDLSWLEATGAVVLTFGDDEE